MAKRRGCWADSPAPSSLPPGPVGADSSAMLSPRRRNPDALTSIHPRFPRYQRRQRLRYRNLRISREQHPANHGRVGHGEVRARNVRLSLQHLVEVPHTRLGLLAVHLTPAITAFPLRALVRTKPFAQARRGVMKVDADGVDQFRLRTLLHHVDGGLLQRRDTGKGGMAIEVIQVLGDRRALRDIRAVVQLEYR